MEGQNLNLLCSVDLFSHLSCIQGWLTIVGHPFFEPPPQ
jgi:hypothetical protein